MPYVGLKVGDKVVVTITSRIRDIDSRYIYLDEQDDAIYTETDTVSIAVDPTPDNWPPQLGDVWRAEHPPDGETDLYAAICGTYGEVKLVEMRGNRGAKTVAEVIETSSATWVLAFRDGKAVS